jgi:hypothetical protein
MGVIDWSWADAATYANGQWDVPSGTVSNPQYHDNGAFSIFGLPACKKVKENELDNPISLTTPFRLGHMFIMAQAVINSTDL